MRCIYSRFRQVAATRSQITMEFVYPTIMLEKVRSDPGWTIENRGFRPSFPRLPLRNFLLRSSRGYFRCTRGREFDSLPIRWWIFQEKDSVRRIRERIFYAHVLTKWIQREEQQWLYQWQWKIADRFDVIFVRKDHISARSRFTFT